jgi:hypothetical protein
MTGATSSLLRSSDEEIGIDHLDGLVRAARCEGWGELTADELLLQVTTRDDRP